MPALIAIFLVMLTGYQLFFRYQSWPSDKTDGAVYERDNLMGVTRIIKPGEQVDFTVRLLGEGMAAQLANIQKPDMENAFNFSMIDVSKSDPDALPSVSSQNPDIARVIEAPKPNAPVSVPLPEHPANPKPLKFDSQKFSSQKVDLNNDGESEEIVQRITADDGLVDISIIRHGREVFYGRGKQLQILNTRASNGWLDIALDTGDPKSAVYKFSSSLDGYSTRAEQTAKR